MFDLNLPKILVLAVIALIVFGPNELPKVAAQAGKMLRDLRRIAEGAKADLRDGLGPEFKDFEFDDLNPKTFVRKHLFDDDEQQALFEQFRASTDFSDGTAMAGATASGAGAGGVGGGVGGAFGQQNGSANSTARTTVRDGEEPPFDFEAT